MFKTNVKYGKRYNWYDIQNVKGKWYAFYNDDFMHLNQRDGKEDPRKL